ncbi:MAG: radical SAM protein, partial [Deltaproteobacteria bacterium]|nr:radical SAM protein [Deltaproteobacteria bacterium]
DRDDVVAEIERASKNVNKIGLIGAAVSEYPWINEVVSAGLELGLTVTLSSLRLEFIDDILLDSLKESGLKTVTVAPEAASERLRRVINKDIEKREILEKVELIRDAGFKRLKLYFMVGLPTESDEDALEIAALTREIKDVFKGMTVTVSVNPFIPKPLTPFQWHPFAGLDVINRRCEAIKKELKGVKGVELKINGVKEAFFQSYIARADRRAASIIIDAASIGIRRAVKKNFDMMTEATQRERPFDEILPWDMIDHGIEKEYLYEEYEKALRGETTPPCIVGSCYRCGVC